MSPHLSRRAWLLAPCLGGWAAQGLAQAVDQEAQNVLAERLLRQGGVVAAFRHATAPGNFDPPEFRLGECSTQRLLSDEGRAQAKRLGQWFARRQLVPDQVRSSPWCRCMDTAQLAFGRAAAWPALGSPRAQAEGERIAHLQQLRSAVVQQGTRRGFEVWVTHMFVLQDLVQVPGQMPALVPAQIPAQLQVQAGEGLILQSRSHAGTTAPLQVLARIFVP